MRALIRSYSTEVTRNLAILIRGIVAGRSDGSPACLFFIVEIRRARNQNMQLLHAVLTLEMQ